MKTYIQTRELLRRKSGSEPTPEDIINVSPQLSLTDIQDYELILHPQLEHLDTRMYDIPIPQLQPINQAEQEKLRTLVRKYLQFLLPRERIAIELRYGLSDNHVYDYNEIMQVLSLNSVNHASAIVSNGLAKLRKIALQYEHPEDILDEN